MPFPDERVPVRIVDYNPRWPDEFGKLAERLRAATAMFDVQVEHVGSTSVVGLPSKDVIDVQIRTASLEDDLINALAAHEFRQRPEPWNRMEVIYGAECPKAVFAAPAAERRANIAVRIHGQPNARAALLFRDFLNANAEMRDAWGQFKRSITDVTTDLARYGRIKAPATEVLLKAADFWASTSAWRMPSFA